MNDKYVQSNPEVCRGRTVIKGTRVPVDTVLQHLIGGWTWEETLDDFPSIKDTLKETPNDD